MSDLQLIEQLLFPKSDSRASQSCASKDPNADFPEGNGKKRKRSRSRETRVNRTFSQATPPPEPVEVADRTAPTTTSIFQSAVKSRHALQAFVFSDSRMPHRGDRAVYIDPQSPWEMRATGTGRAYYVNTGQDMWTWEDPFLPPMPIGWEMYISKKGLRNFWQLGSKESQREDPRGTSIPLRSPFGPASINAPNRAVPVVHGEPARQIASPSTLAEPRAQSELAQSPESASQEPRLCKEQEELVDLIMSGRNVFYTGSAGCGKSTVLKAFVKKLKEAGKKVDIVAPTGRAALDVNGLTYWSYAGWHPDFLKNELEVLRNAAHGKKPSKRLRATEVLIFDEISMVGNQHFERLNVIMKEARGNNQPFGGVQLVVTGDFCQLAPVDPFQYCMECGKKMEDTKLENERGNEYKCSVSAHSTFRDRDKWAFQSRAWAECDFAYVNLTTIHRQSDKVFIDVLNKFRLGTPLDAKDKKLLENHPSNTEGAVRLFSTREEVARFNDKHFRKLETPILLYRCVDYCKIQDRHRHLAHKGFSLKALEENHRFENEIQLREGMLVVLLVNLDMENRLINGSQGVIVGFEENDYAKLPKKSGRKEPPFESDAIIGEHANLRERQIEKFINSARVQQWPIVKFFNGVTRTIYANCTVNELGEKDPTLCDDKQYSLLARTQIPLTAAWAMTIHRAQGMSLERVIVDLRKCFEEAQRYVALSRATSLDGLKVEHLGDPVMEGNAEVKEFLREKFGIE